MLYPEKAVESTHTNLGVKTLTRENRLPFLSR